MTRTVAIVEDEPEIRENYAAALRKQGYHVMVYGNREDASKAFSTALPDLAILDVGLGDDAEGGFELCRQLRAKSATVPIVFLTARDSDLDVISGLRLGADDYLTKSVSLAHLCARIAALFRRIDALTGPTAADSRIVRGELILDTDRFSASWKNKPLELTLTEFWIIRALAIRPGHVKSREQLMNEANIVVDDATVTSHVKRLRNKFLAIDPAFGCIDTVYGMGYRWVEPGHSIGAVD